MATAIRIPKTTSMNPKTRGRLSENGSATRRGTPVVSNHPPPPRHTMITPSQKTSWTAVRRATDDMSFSYQPGVTGRQRLRSSNFSPLPPRRKVGREQFSHKAYVAICSQQPHRTAARFLSRYCLRASRPFSFLNLACEARARRHCRRPTATQVTPRTNVTQLNVASGRSSAATPVRTIRAAATHRRVVPRFARDRGLFAAG